MQHDGGGAAAPAPAAASAAAAAGAAFGWPRRRPRPRLGQRGVGWRWLDAGRAWGTSCNAPAGCGGRQLKAGGGTVDTCPHPKPPSLSRCSEDYFQEGQSVDEVYYEEEAMAMEVDDESMRLYLDSADVQVGRREQKRWARAARCAHARC